jgi:hypothetical protein
MSASLLVFVFGAVDWVVRASEWVYRKARAAIHDRPAAAADAEAALQSSGRRRFLERTAVLVSATPFLAAGYGLLYERQNVEVVRQRIRRACLPPRVSARCARRSGFEPLGASLRSNP